MSLAMKRPSCYLSYLSRRKIVVRAVFGVKETGLPVCVLDLMILPQLEYPSLALDGAASLGTLPVWLVLTRMLLHLLAHR